VAAGHLDPKVLFASVKPGAKAAAGAADATLASSASRQTGVA
jgi:hypothetical protein